MNQYERGNQFLAPHTNSGIKIKFRPYRNAAGTMSGWIEVELQSGLVIRDCKLMRGPNGTPWIAMPAVKATDRDGEPILGKDGKQVWNTFVDFASKETRDTFQRQVLDALRRQHPEALS